MGGVTAVVGVVVAAGGVAAGQTGGGHGDDRDVVAGARGDDGGTQTAGAAMVRRWAMRRSTSPGRSVSRRAILARLVSSTTMVPAWPARVAAICR